MFHKLQFKHFDDWMNLSNSHIKQKGIASLLSSHYSNNICTLLSSIYPNYPWSFLTVPNPHSSQKERKRFIDELVAKLHLRSPIELIHLPKHVISLNGGEPLLSFYSNDLRLLLQSLYPHLASIITNEIENDQKLLKRQRKRMSSIAQTLCLHSLDDWMYISKSKFILHGGRHLLDQFSNDFTRLLTTLYPYHTWNFENIKYKHHPSFADRTSHEYCLRCAHFLQQKYVIRRKSDWFRLRVRTDGISVLQTLKVVFPNDEWCKNEFQLRRKRSVQRLLYVFIQNLLPHHYIIEDYRLLNTPTMMMTMMSNVVVWELDVYIPSLQIAFEYQGEHHYEDLPSGFNQLESYQSHDKVKMRVVSSKNIILIYVPYWWDRSCHSLLSTLACHMSNFVFPSF